MFSSWFTHQALLLNAIDTRADGANQNFLDYFQATDAVGKTLWVILIIMALITWYIIFAKLIGGFLRKQKCQKFFSDFWDRNPSPEQAVQHFSQNKDAKDPYSRITRSALQAQYHQVSGVDAATAENQKADFVTRAIRREIEQETSTLEKGLTWLGSIGSTAPFVGLFGTVWGVFHALTSISGEQGYTINQVAGPVGEALIMTGLGLAVAIPAVLALNFFVRRNRLALSRIDNFAYDIFAFVTTGQSLSRGDFSQLKGHFDQKSSVIK